ncbi:zinc finger C2HC domain-containing protein 1C [Dromaius novaehollandiae]|uniref:Zinc finger C2HC-type containing 1C n=2 Tax=Dromaius novaehollandiae TaxID=8790 RepID=A0A8C4J709_DRONO|nr:zinc finger C2HC domain-containing protein 1C [Dromaius novaehollandiae]XP_025976056.1 zinc finger C2HC domain-containing protein 1C [Dromaius novaehollandiae]XP_025976057.1 zinc finger C2HC domain-containing protein 1C [Dromaius novaehollandiae]
MAELQLALFPPVDSVVAAPKLPVTGRYDSKVPVHQSQLEHLKSTFHHKLLHDKEESLKDLYTPKTRSYSYSLSAESSRDSSKQGGCCLAGLQSKYLTSQAKTLPSKSVARRREGVDRSYPLKPIFHRKARSVPAVNAAQLRSPPYMEESLSSWSSSKSKGKPPAGKSQLAAVLSPWTVEPKQPASPLYRRELAYILRLEADGQNLEEEIRKKEALLREKLRRTKEELRRIQREKELVEAEERRAREAEKTPERKATRHSEENVFRIAVRPGDGDFDRVQSPEVTRPKLGTTLHPQELAMGKLKKERLVASNSKIRDCIPVEDLASCSEPVSKHSHSPSTLSDQESGDHLATEMLYMQAASAVEQGELGQCSFCGRKFLCARLEQHTNICSKSQGSKRKVFDSSKARARGTDLEQYRQWKSSESPQNEPLRKNNWRQKHESFIQTLRQARQVQQVLSKGGKVSELPPLPPVENPDYIACPYCSRRFAPKVAERHIPKCKTIKNRPPPPPQKRCC